MRVALSGRALGGHQATLAPRLRPWPPSQASRRPRSNRRTLPRLKAGMVGSDFAHLRTDFDETLSRAATSFGVRYSHTPLIWSTGGATGLEVRRASLGAARGARAALEVGLEGWANPRSSEATYSRCRGGALRSGLEAYGPRVSQRGSRPRVDRRAIGKTGNGPGK